MMSNSIAEQTLALMRAQGFEHAQVSVLHTEQDELNIAHNQPSLLRSTQTQKLSLLGLVDARKASTELNDFAPDAIARTVKALYTDALGAPQDAANAVSAGQKAVIEQGPMRPNLDLLADTVAQLLAFRAAHTPRMMIDEGLAAHSLVRGHTLTSGGSDLRHTVGSYSISVFGTAREGSRSSSFNYTGGDCHDLSALPAQQFFGIEDMLRETEQQIFTQGIADKFVGEVLLSPNAVCDVLEWLQAQISDVQLISGSSLYKDRVGQQIASPLLSLRSRFDAPGVAAISADAFATKPLTVLQDGRLQTLIPSLYASRKTGIPHVPVAAAGWEIAAGSTPRAEMLAAVKHGALVGRLSMGMPAPNGDFSGVIKNSFLIENGQRGTALSEVMISGNIAQMLHDVLAVSHERLDTGSLLLPWLRIGNLRFS
jgi:PmbA protein